MATLYLYLRVGIHVFFSYRHFSKVYITPECTVYTEETLYLCNRKYNLRRCLFKLFNKSSMYILCMRELTVSADVCVRFFFVTHCIIWQVTINRLEATLQTRSVKCQGSIAFLRSSSTYQSMRKRLDYSGGICIWKTHFFKSAITAYVPSRKQVITYNNGSNKLVPVNVSWLIERPRNSADPLYTTRNFDCCVAKCGKYHRVAN